MKGRRLGRSASHRKAMFRNMASALFLTEKEWDPEVDDNIPKVKGRIVTTLPKAKEVRPLVEKCITIARKALAHERAAEEFATSAERRSDEWRAWRNSDTWQKWNAAIAPALAARRRAVKLLGDKEAVQILFSEIAPRFEHRDGGYTRILKLAMPRLGDSGARAILEFVGQNDRVAKSSQKPAFADEVEAPTSEDAPQDEVAESSEDASDDNEQSSSEEADK